MSLWLWKLCQFGIQVFQGPFEEGAVLFILRGLEHGGGAGTGEQDAFPPGSLFDLDATRLLSYLTFAPSLAFVDLVFDGFTFPTSCHA